MSKFLVVLIAVMSLVPLSATAREYVVAKVREAGKRDVVVKDGPKTVKGSVQRATKPQSVKIPTDDCGLTVEFATPSDCSKVKSVKTSKGKADVKFSDGTDLHIRDVKGKLVFDYDD